MSVKGHQAGTRPDVPITDNSAKIYAKALFGTTPVIYAPPGMDSLARRWQTQLNENSKLIARWDTFPEMNHNDIVGVSRRIEFTKKVLEKRMAAVIEVWPRGETRLARMLQHLYLGDCTSLYLAVLRGVDPFEIEAINQLKDHLAQK